MIFNKHSELEGRHALFSPSQPHWLRYDSEKAVRVMTSMKAKSRGTRLHEWAAETIRLGIKQPKSKKTLYAYVNDAIGYKMDVERILYYSDKFFGTADAICFRNNLLRIHDLKTGELDANIEQLEIYAALFCLEYKVNPTTIEFELRLYQKDAVIVHTPNGADIKQIMDHIVYLDNATSKDEYEEA